MDLFFYRVEPPRGGGGGGGGAASNHTGRYFLRMIFLFFKVSTCKWTLFLRGGGGGGGEAKGWGEQW